ncbi:MAG: PH domain-containing protein [Oscillospiraceae bacterium]
MSIENDIARAEINKVAIVPSIVAALIIDVILLAFSISSYDEYYILISSIISVGILVVFVGFKLFVLSHIKLALTKKRIYGKTGIINTKSMDSPISKINSVSVEQGFWGKVFRYSTVSVSTSSGNYKFSYIKNADEFKEKTMEQIDAYENEKLKNQFTMLAGKMSE